MSNKLLPIPRLGILGGSGYQSEVLGVFVGEQVEEAVAVLEQIFVVVLPGKHDLPLSPRLTTAQSPELGRGGAGRAQKQISLVSRSANEDAIQLVLFLVHQIVGRCAQDMSIEAVRSFGGILDRIEERAVVG